MRLLVMCPVHIPLINWLHSYVQSFTHEYDTQASSNASRRSQHHTIDTGIHGELLTAQILRMHGVKVEKKQSSSPKIIGAVLLSVAQDLYEQYAMIREILPSRCESEQSRLVAHLRDPDAVKCRNVDRRPLDVSTGCSVFFETAATMLYRVLNHTPTAKRKKGSKRKGKSVEKAVANMPSLLAVVSSLHDVRQAAAAWSAGKHAAGFGSYGLLRPTQLQVVCIDRWSEGETKNPLTYVCVPNTGSRAVVLVTCRIFMQF